MTEKLTDKGPQKRSSKNECCILVLMKTVFVVWSSDLHLKVSQTHSEFARFEIVSAERLCRKRLADRILKQFNFCTHIRNESVSCERIYVLCETASQNDLIFTSEHVDFWNVLI
jgi:hypothetical protein